MSYESFTQLFDSLLLTSLSFSLTLPLHMTLYVRRTVRTYVYSLISSLVVIPVFKFKIPRIYAYYLVAVYCGYMLFSGLVVGGVLHILA